MTNELEIKRLRHKILTMLTFEERMYIQPLLDKCLALAERPEGEWIIDGHHYKCSRCGKTLAIMFSETDDDDLIGCPFCLADMRGKNELNDELSESDNLCDDCKLADNCTASLKGLTGCKTTKCFRHEWAEKEKEK